MHELSIASAIAAVAGEHAHGRRVTAVEVTVGRLRQVVPDALTFAWAVATEGTELEGAELTVEHVPARVACRRCEAESGIDAFPLACASCGSADVEVVGGDELHVESLELEEYEANREAEERSTLVGGR